MDLTTKDKLLLLGAERELAEAGFTRRPNELPPYPLPTKDVVQWWRRRGTTPATWIDAVKKQDIRVEKLTPFKMWREGWFHLAKGRFIPPYLLGEAIDYAEHLRALKNRGPAFLVRSI